MLSGGDTGDRLAEVIREFKAIISSTLCLSLRYGGMPDPEGAVEATVVTGWGRNGDRGSRVAGSSVVRGAGPAGQVDLDRASTEVFGTLV